MRYISNLKNKGEKLALVACASGAVFMSASCSQKAPSADYDTASNAENAFHADNDIAMTVRSLVDAVRVGETLSPEDYDFVGILTDGQGTPLYTDFEGAPGEWSVKVESAGEASISNLRIGDLMDDDLRAYILDALKINAADHVSTYRNPQNEEQLVSHYDTGDVDINFLTITAFTPSGFEGTLMTIRISKKRETPHA